MREREKKKEDGMKGEIIKELQIKYEGVEGIVNWKDII